ncbi:UNVERIFIED_CONTAM: hypothetical protein Sangu_0155700 [Sesamum angustifolium]|uniref:TF-B3 domain-containing protein n=1 Tax=Sesamum angustifolium TaxID=2727405 RepID=A0AAW2RLF2_9LAMI
MNSSLNQPSFFTPLIGDFSTQLSIPVEFARRHKDMLHGKVRLETESQESWAVRSNRVATFSMDGCDKCYPSSDVDGIQELGLTFFPASFAAKTGLGRKSKITLRDPSGRKWPVTIFNRERPDRIETSTGWNEFLAAQKLFVGSIISLESVPGSDDLFQVKVLKNRGEGGLLRAVNKNLGRPQVGRRL